MGIEPKSISRLLGCYLGAVAVVGIALALRLGLSGVLGSGLAYITFYPAVMLVAILSGLGPGLLATGLAALLACYWIHPPPGFAVGNVADVVGLAVFLGMGVLMSLVAEFYRRARRKVAVLERESAVREAEERVRKESERALRESEQRLRTLVAATFEGIGISEGGRFVDVNEPLAQMLGYAREELVGREVAGLVAPEDRTRVLENILEGRESRIEHEMLRKDGSRITVEAHGQTVGMNGRRVRFTALRNITERQRAERALQENEERLRLLFQGVKDYAIYMLDLEGRMVTWNRGAEQLIGYSAGEILGQNFAKFFTPEDCAEGKPARELAMAAEQGSYIEEAWRVRKDGSRFWARATLSAVHGPAGELRGFAKVTQDLTERRQAEEALRESEAKYRQLVELLPIAVYSCDCEGAVTFYNEHAVALWGRRPEPGQDGTQFCGCLQARVASGESTAPWELPLTRACREGQSFRNGEGIVERPDGTRVDVLLNIDPVRDGKGEVTGATVVLTDITERKRTRTALQNQNRRLGLLNEAAAQLLLAAEPERAMAGIYERIAGYFQTSGFFEFEVSEPGDELRLKTCACLSALEGKESCESTRVKMGEGIVGMVAQQRKGMVLGRVQESAEPHTERLKGLGVRAYACYPLVVGERLLGILSFASRQRESFEVEDQEFFETLAGYLALARERERLSRELRRHAENLERAVAERTAKLRELVAEMEHMSYSMIHDMRAPLRAMNSFAHILQARAKARLTEEELEHLQRIISSSERLDHLVTDALNYNKAVRHELVLGPVDAGELLKGMLKSYPEFQAPRAEIRLEGSFPRVQGNASALTQCFSHLLQNAVKFVPPGKLPRVKVYAEVRRESGAGGEGPAGPVVRLWFEDNGVGIAPEGQKRIFNLFQQVHPGYGGTGIGLTLVRKLTEHMGGKVGVESEEEKGSRFWLELKAAAEPQATSMEDGEWEH